MLAEYFGYFFFGILLAYIQILIPYAYAKKGLLLLCIVLLSYFTYKHVLYIIRETYTFTKIEFNSMFQMLFIIVTQILLLKLYKNLLF